MKTKILVTGATGFVGTYLLEHLETNGNNILFGTYFSGGKDDTKTQKNKTSFVKLDLRNEKDVKDLIKRIRPDIIYHLAAFTSPKESFSSPNETIINNISSQINILEALRENNLTETRLLITSSAEVYGLVDKKYLPIDEKVDFNPTNPYAVSKLAQDFLGRQYFLSYGLKIIRVRPFNHIGPRQSPNFVVSAFSKKIAEIEKNQREPVLTVGNLEAKRDFTDVRDVVRAYTLLIGKGKIGDVYNIGSGTSYKISEILERLVLQSKTKIRIETDKSLFRPIDNPDLVCNFNKIKEATGWEPEIPIGQSLKDTLDYWRNII